MEGFAFLARIFWLGIGGMRWFPKMVSPLLAVLCVSLAGCSVMDVLKKGQTRAREVRAMAELRSQARAEHAFHRSLAGWKKTTYRNKTLLASATPENVAVEIALKEQRGLLLVNGAIAMDFPIASGKKTHPTPTGSYTIRAKEKDYASNLYGKVYDASGVIVVEDADTRENAIPEGGRFEGAKMPYWMRLTDSGVGLHVGYVPGRPASHGCIRLKNDTAAELFKLTKIGTPVVIAESAPALVVAERR